MATLMSLKGVEEVTFLPSTTLFHVFVWVCICVNGFTVNVEYLVSTINTDKIFKEIFVSEVKEIKIL